MRVIEGILHTMVGGMTFLTCVLSGDFVTAARMNQALVRSITYEADADWQVTECTSLQAELADLALKGQMGARRGLLALRACSGSAVSFLAEWKPVLDESVEDPIAEFQSGFVYYEAEQLDHAISHWRQSGSFSYFFALSKSLMSRHRLTDSLHWARIAEQVGHSPDLSDLYSDLAYSFLLESDWENAIDACEAATTLAPRNARAHYACGKSYLAMERLGDAIVSFRRAIDAGGVGMWSHFYLGIAYHEIGEAELARQAFREAVLIEPEHEAPYRWLGYIDMQQGNYEEALGNLQVAVDLSPSSRYAWLYMLFIYDRIGDKSQLRETALKAIELFPSSSTPYVYLASSLREEGTCPSFLDTLDMVQIGDKGDLHTLSPEVLEQLQGSLALCDFAQ